MRVSRKKIGRFIAATLWISAGITLIVFLVAAMRMRDDKLCSGLNIEITDTKNNLFADKNDIGGMINYMVPGVKGKPISDFNLQQMEKTMESNIWIKDAELFFDNNEILQVKVKEREPAARIFTQSGKSYYIDKAFVRLPLSTKFSARVPVFTNCPLDKTKWNTEDSTVLAQVTAISSFLMNDDFWMAQIEQVDYTAQKQFIMYPKIGDHAIILGDGNDLESKFRKLFIFYKEVLAKSGWDNYSTINVQFKGQVVAVPRNQQKMSVN